MGGGTEDFMGFASGEFGSCEAAAEEEALKVMVEILREG